MPLISRKTPVQVVETRKRKEYFQALDKCVCGGITAEHHWFWTGLEWIFNARVPGGARLSPSQKMICPMYRKAERGPMQKVGNSFLKCVCGHQKWRHKDNGAYIGEDSKVICPQFKWFKDKGNDGQQEENTDGLQETTGKSE
jgi:hypothetical protein